MTSPPTDCLEVKWLTREQVMFVFDIGESTLDEWQRKKLLPCFKVGRVVRFDPRAVMDFIHRFYKHSRLLAVAPERNELEEMWARMQRLIADQVRAEVLKQCGSEPRHIAA